MEVPFQKPNAEVATAVTENTNAQLVPIQNTTIGTVVQDEQQDLVIPRLKLVYGTSKFIDKFNIGDVVLDDSHLLITKANKLCVTFVDAVKYYKEDVSNEARTNGVYPRRFLKAADVLAAGGILEYDNARGIKPNFRKAVDFRMLIKKPDNITCEYFAFDIDGDKYAPAKWTADKATYKRGKLGVGQVLDKAITYALQNGKKPLFSITFDMYITVEQFKENTTPYLNIVYKGVNTEAFNKQISNIFSAGATIDAEEIIPDEETVDAL